MEHGFDSRRRYKSSKLKSIKVANLKLWRFRLVARTHASHAWNTGSIPVGATSVRTLSGSNFFCLRANSPSVYRGSTALAGREFDGSVAKKCG